METRTRGSADRVYALIEQARDIEFNREGVCNPAFFHRSQSPAGILKTVFLVSLSTYSDSLNQRQHNNIVN